MRHYLLYYAIAHFLKVTSYSNNSVILQCSPYIFLLMYILASSIRWFMQSTGTRGTFPDVAPNNFWNSASTICSPRNLEILFSTMFHTDNTIGQLQKMFNIINNRAVLAVCRIWFTNFMKQNLCKVNVVNNFPLLTLNLCSFVALKCDWKMTQFIAL